MNLPSFLHTKKSSWPALIASGIHTKHLTSCCRFGCVHCHFIGFKRTTQGHIADIAPKVYTTPEYAKKHHMKPAHVVNLCDSGKLTFFRTPNSKKRYIIEE